MTECDNNTSSTPDYTMGFSETILDAFRRYTAESNAGYLLPHLGAGQRVLDLGSGPGTISVGLARAILPGELYGIDMDEAMVGLSRYIAAQDGIENAHFQVADALELPFEDGYFDAVHCHNVLLFIPDTHAVLEEVQRVLKPKGVFGCREMINESCFTHPDFGVLRRAWDMFEDLLAADDGHPQMGKQVKAHLMEAGFEDIRVSASFDVYVTPEDVEFIYGVAHQWFLAPEITEAAIKYGAATRELADAIGSAYGRWKDHPGAFCGLAWGEALAVTP